jgi:WD40 repeat protein
VQAKKPRDCAFLPDSRHVVFATANIVRIINVLDGKDVLTLEHPGEIWALALAPDGITLAISVKLSQEETDSVWIWRLEGI